MPFKKNQKIINFTDLLIITFLLSISIMGVFYASKPEHGKRVLIFTPYGNYAYLLNIDKTLNVKGKMGEFIIRIENGKVWVLETNCPKKICKRLKIHRVNDSIVCIPNMIEIKIEGDEKEKLDGITE